MPASFDNCVKKGGKVITKELPKNRYMHICYMDGKGYPSDVKTKMKKMMMKK